MRKVSFVTKAGLALFTITIFLTALLFIFNTTKSPAEIQMFFRLLFAGSVMLTLIGIMLDDGMQNFAKEKTTEKEVANKQAGERIDAFTNRLTDHT